MVRLGTRKCNVRPCTARVVYLLAALAIPFAQRPANAQQPAPSGGQTYQLKPSPKTVVWGYYDAKTSPVLRIKSGDTVEIQTLIASNPERFEAAGIGDEQ